MPKLVSVIISTHNPSPARLARTLAGLELQTLDQSLWQLVLVDNASDTRISRSQLAYNYKNLVLVHEERLGLTYGRCRGIECLETPYAILVDDDNVLSSSYLDETVEIFERNMSLGIGGGKSIPEYETSPPDWIAEFHGNLALRDLGPDVLLASGSTTYPPAAPIGAGMIARSDLLQSWARRASCGIFPGRKGKKLTSGEDCDLVMHALRLGWQVGYFPSLELLHLIPKARLEPEYLARLNYGIAKSWVEVLDANGIRPWPRAGWGLAIRKTRAYVRNRAWVSDRNYIRWRGACGAIEGRATIAANTTAPLAPPCSTLPTAL